MLGSLVTSNDMGRQINVSLYVCFCNTYTGDEEECNIQTSGYQCYRERHRKMYCSCSCESMYIITKHIIPAYFYFGCLYNLWLCLYHASAVAVLLTKTFSSKNWESIIKKEGRNYSITTLFFGPTLSCPSCHVPQLICLLIYFRCPVLFLLTNINYNNNNTQAMSCPSNLVSEINYILYCHYH